MDSKFAGSGWQAFSLYNPETGDVVQVNDIDHERSGYEPEAVKTENANSVYTSQIHRTARFAGFDWQGMELIEEWRKNKTPINAVVAGSPDNGKSLLWYEDTVISELNFEDSANRRDPDRSWQVVLEHWGNNAKIRSGVNLLDMVVKMQGFATGWQDSEGDNLPDGPWRTYGSTNEDFSDGVFSHESTSGSWQLRMGDDDAIPENGIPFPISGIQLIMSVQIVGSYGGNSYNTVIVQNDYSGNTIDSSRKNHGSLEDERIVEGPVTTQSNVYYIGIRPNDTQGSDDIGTSVSMRDPVARVGTSDQYTNY